jgi:thiamine biosynthesis lipoprotein ApbE
LEKEETIMKSQALQNLIQKIFSDEKTKQQFISDPESVISRYNLTDQEKKAVLNTHAKLGLITSDSIQLEAALDPTFTWFAPTP